MLRIVPPFAPQYLTFADERIRPAYDLPAAVADAQPALPGTVPSPRLLMAAPPVPFPRLLMVALH